MLTSAQFKILQDHVDAGDRIAYYSQLAAWGDVYGSLALGVVNNDSTSGATANNFFVNNAGPGGTPAALPFSTLAFISLDLMEADFLARQEANTSGQNPLDLSVDTIEGYHTQVFAKYGVAPYAWTPYFALQQLTTVEDREALWDQLLQADGFFGSVSAFAQTLASYYPAVSFDIAEFEIDLITAGSQALVAGSTDFGPYQVSLDGNRGLVIGGNSTSNGLTGAVSNDVIMGFDGDDVLDGGAGADRLYGGAGNDTLFGGSGASSDSEDGKRDILAGGAGNDIYRIDRGENWDPTKTLSDLIQSIDHITDAEGNDVLMRNGTVLDVNWKQTSSGYVGNGSDSNYYLFQEGNFLVFAVGNNLGGYYGESTIYFTLDLIISNQRLVSFDPNAVAALTSIDTDGRFFGMTLLDLLNQMSGTAVAETLAGTTARDYIQGLAGNDTIDGGSDDDVIDGGDGNDILTGGTGADDLIGGSGNDTYYVDNVSDDVDESFNGGIDSVFSSVSFTLGSSVENLTLTGIGAINGTGSIDNNIITGNAGSNVLRGNSGNDILNGGAGDDTLEGGYGNDTLVGGTGIDTIVFDGNREDYIFVSVNATQTQATDLDGLIDLFSEIEIVRFADASFTLSALLGTSPTINGSVSNDTLVGTSGNDTISGFAGNDTLNGGVGLDLLNGGLGDDTYIVDSATDIITEAEDAGVDTLQSSVTVVTLAANVENLTLTGSANIDGTGNSMNNFITGTAANNSLNGGDGNDTLNSLAGNDILNGGAGIDTLIGGLGDDTYVVDSATDTITEAASAGTDTLQSSVTIAALAANVENLTLTGAVAINGTGNTLNNTITGNAANNTLDGGAGDDTLIGGAGNDTLIGGSGTDTLVLAGNRAEYAFVMLDGNQIQITDTVAGRDGIDLVKEIENVRFADGTFLLSSLPGAGQAINGTAGNDNLTGTTGNDILNGGVGVDTLAGGLGDDIYVVDSATDVIIEGAYAGTDTLQSSVTITALAANVENLTLTGTAAVNGAGNVLNNVITGNSANNTLNGGDGNDTLNGGAGIDTLIGGLGNDAYIVDTATDIITESASAGTDTVQSSVTIAALAANVENLILIGSAALNGAGNSLDNVITGNAANNTLNGGDGNDRLNGGDGLDTLNGGLGDDIYVVDSGTDIIAEAANAGTDVLQSSVTIAALAANVENLTLVGTAAINGTGNALNNVIIGNAANNTLNGGAGNDTLNGGAGTDTLIGGLGDDIYVVDSATDIITEGASAGTDTLQSSITIAALAANVENLTLTGAAAINGTGNTLNNIITGNAANNTLDGGAGSDTLVGGLGDDLYVVDSAGDLVIEAANAGRDTLFSSVTIAALAANVEDMTLIGTAAINGTGNAFDNVIGGNSANNLLDGGAGNDFLAGNAGNDTLIGGTGTDTLILTGTRANYSFVTLNATQTQVTDSIAGRNGVDLLSEIENVQFADGVFTLSSLLGTGQTINGTAGNDNLTGTSGNDTINGLAGNDILNGGAGVDTLIGGLGDDIYVVDTATDIITEAANAGADTLQSSVTIAALAANVENLTLTGTAAINGIGNALNNSITGNSANNTLDGGAGNDTLVGGAGTDTLIGGLGDDTYVVDSATDLITEAASAGTDTLQSSVTITALAANVENLTLTGTAAINGTGNTLNNIITGNAANNILNGGAGVDTLIGGLGDDIYVVDSATDIITEAASAGTDTLQSSVTIAALAANVENLTLTGTAAVNGTGNALNNIITGNAGNNILNGGAGNDTLNGGAGTDTLVLTGNRANYTFVTLNATQTQVTDSVAGRDGVDLFSEVENVQFADGTFTLASLLGAGQTINGTSGNDNLTGTSGNDTINGLAGNDTLSGGAGTDTLIGGLGHDIYVVDSATDIITEAASAGTDTVQSSVTIAALAANVENLTLTGTAAISGTGNALNNVITGNAAANILNGGAGTDTLIGGLGDDIYVVDSATDIITEAASAGTDTVQSSVTIAALAANVENLTLTGTAAINGTGNALNNVITGNAAANILNGGAGVDTLIGGLGDDIYVVDSATDIITEAASAGTDTLQSSITIAALAANVENLTLTGTAAINGTGNALNNIITGNAANNILNGGAGVDTLVGGLGDDTYLVDSATDIITEAASAGTDTLQSSVTIATLAANIENLTLTGTAVINGTGNALNNIITGNTANNTLDGGAGNDTLNGGAGTDTLIGGLGDDIYVVDTATDIITEAASAGTDTLQSSVTIAALAANVENLTFTGSAAINGSGNTLNNIITGNAANNTLDGGAGNDTLNGGAGTDTLVGGLGDDIYIVDTATDIITEAASAGIDTLQSSVTIAALAANVENLTLTGTAAINGTGNTLNNIITGNAGINTLNGGAGNDVLNGGGGADYLQGGDGDDRIIIDELDTAYFGDAGVDTIVYQGAANLDYALAQGSFENAEFGSGANTVWGCDCDNQIDGGAGNDTLFGYGGTDILIGGAGADSLQGGDGNDTVYIDLADTWFAGDAGIDTVIHTGTDSFQIALDTGAFENATMGGGNDTIWGTALANTISLGAGNDRVTGAGGADILTGGAGADVFVFVAAAESTLGAGADSITDFVKLSDRIDLLGIDANPILAADQAFSFIGAAAFSNQAGQLRAVTNASTTSIFGDVNGDGVADFQINLTGVMTMAATDFIL